MQTDFKPGALEKLGKLLVKCLHVALCITEQENTKTKWKRTSPVRFCFVWFFVFFVVYHTHAHNV